MKLSLNEPNLSKLELKYVRDVIEKNWLSIGGNHTKIFEKKFSKYLGIKYSISRSKWNSRTTRHLKRSWC